MAKVTEARWQEIKLEYLAGVKSKDLSEKFNIDYTTLTNKISRDGWSELLRQKITMFNKLYLETQAEEENQAIIDMKQKERERAENIAIALENQLVVTDSESGEKKINPKLSSQDVSSLANTLEKIQKVNYKSHGISDKLDIDAKVTLPTTINFIKAK